MSQTQERSESLPGPPSALQELVEVVAGGFAALKIDAPVRLCVGPSHQGCICLRQPPLSTPWGPPSYLVAHPCPLAMESASRLFTPMGGVASWRGAFLCTPIQVEDGLAAWQVGGHPRRWEEAPPPALAALLSLAAEALQNLLLTTALRQHSTDLEARLQEASRRLVDIQEAERLRVCLEVHDSVAASLAGVHQLLQPLLHTLRPSSPAQELAQKAFRGVGQATQELRRLLSSLQPEALQTQSMAKLLRDEATRLRRVTGARVEVQVEEVDLPPETSFGLLRIAQEALANVRAHAQARRALIALRPDQGTLLLEIRDWGQGFDPTATPQQRLGLFSMRQRTHLLGGDYQLASSPGQGTTVAVRIPLPALQAPLVTREP